MKTLSSVLCFLLGVLAGWALAERLPEPAVPPPLPIPAAPSSKEIVLRQELDRARTDLIASLREKEILEDELREARTALRSRPEPPPAPPPDPPPAQPKPATRPPDPLPRGFDEQLKSARSVRTLMAMRPGRDIRVIRLVLARARELLKTPEAQEEFLRDLPLMSKEELVQLWDAFWLNERDRLQGFSEFGRDFAPRLTDKLLDLIYARNPDPQMRGLYVNLLLPDTKSMSDVKLEALRQALETDPDPGLREQAGKLPKRW